MKMTILMVVIKMLKTMKLIKLNVYLILTFIYTQDDKEHAETDRRNKGKYDKDLYLLRYNNLFCLIKYIQSFIHSL